MDPSVPSHPVTPPPNVSLLGPVVAFEDSEVAAPTTGRYWRQLLSMAWPCLQNDPPASGKGQGPGSGSNEWLAEGGRSCTLQHVKVILAPGYLTLANSLAPWVWVLSTHPCPGP